MPGSELVRIMLVIGPEQTVCEAGVAVATGSGFTVPVTGTLGELEQAIEV